MKTKLLALFIIVITFTSTPVLSQPPDPGGDPDAVSINNLYYVFFLLILGIVYVLFNLKSCYICNHFKNK